MSEENAKGLSRHIPADVKREVRQRCGFGCVICGSALYDYEHFSPPFAWAERHAAEGIVLLCPTHHRGKGGTVAHQAIEDASRNPFAKQQGYAATMMIHGSAPPRLRLGSNVGEDVDVMLRVQGQEILALKSPEVPGGPYRVNANFAGSDGKGLEIVENEIRVGGGNWDVEYVGPRLKIRNGRGDVAISAEIRAGGEVGFDAFGLSVGGFEVFLDQGALCAAFPGGGRMMASDHEIAHAAVFVDLTDTELAVGRGRGDFRMTGKGGRLWAINPRF